MEQPRPNETLRDFLDRRERELMHQVAAIEGELRPRKKELDEVRRAKAMLGMQYGNPLSDLAAVPLTLRSGDSVNALAQSSGNATLLWGSLAQLGTSSNALASYAGMTIKQLVLRALFDHFHEGATAPQLREFIRDAYGREIEPSSLSPQLTRLREEGLIERPGPGMLFANMWKLVPGNFARFGFNFDRDIEAPSANTEGAPKVTDEGDDF
jgi:hypothetical protein